MVQFSRIPFDSLSGVTGSRSDLYGSSTTASYAQLVHDRRVLFLKNKKEMIATPDNDLDAAICCYNEAMGEILVGLKDKLDQYSPEDLQTLTPQKLILDEVDIIRSLVLKESRKLENSPAVKKAKEERKLRNLMSMRLEHEAFHGTRWTGIEVEQVKGARNSELDERMRGLKSELQSFEGEENDEVHRRKAIKAVKRLESGNLFTNDHEDFQKYIISPDKFLAHLRTTLKGSMRRIPSTADGSFNYFKKQNRDTRQFSMDLLDLKERFSCLLLPSQTSIFETAHT